MEELNLSTLDLQSAKTQTDLAAYLEQLASYDFERFIYLLYRVDIEEAKVRELITDNDKVYDTLAEWIIERLRSRQQNKDLYTYPDREEDEGRW